MESSDEVDKIKYWQYKLSQKQKTQAAKETNKTRNNKPKTPEKKKKMPASPILHDNFFTSTIDKLKHLLQDSVVRKSQEPISAHAKRSKDVTATKSSIKGATQPLKKLKQGDSIRLTKSISLVNGPKLSKRLNEQEKNRLLKTSPKKSKSRSKSKKYKTDKSKDLIKTVQLKASPQKKTSKKKTKEKVSKKKGDGIQLTAFDEQDPIWSKVQMDTIIVHEKSDYQEYFPSDTVNFKIWQEQQQKQYVKKLQNATVIQSYLHSFATFALFQKQKGRQSLRNSREALNLSYMIKNQEEKLLELKDYLRRLKNTQNLNESLELIITKVNENIKGLKHMKHIEEINRIKSQSQKDLMVHEEQIEDSKEVQFDKQSEHQSSQIEEPYSSKDYLSPRNPIKEQKDNILMVDSLCISNYELSHKKVEKQSSFSRQKDQQIQNLKQESSLLLINSKFNDNSLLNYSTLNTKATDKTNQKNTIYIEEEGHKSSLLLSAESKSDIQLLSPDFKMVSGQIKDKSQLSSYLPKFQIQGGKQDKFIDTRSPTLKRIQQKSQISSSVEKQLVNSNKSLNDSLSKIISNSIKKQDSSPTKECKQKQQINPQLRNQLLQSIFDDLLVQITQFLGSHQQSLERLFSHYNGEIVDVYEGEAMEGVNDVFSQNGGPIQSSDAYLIELAMKVLEVAKDSGLRQKLTKPLGVTTLITLRYMRHLDQNAEENMEEQLEELDSYAEILDHQDFEMFQAKCSSDPEHAEQLILNRCLYDALNVILDDLRPYGGRGRPAFCFGEKPHEAPSLSKIKKFVEMQLKRLLDIRMGIIGNDKIPQQELNALMNQSLTRYNLNLVQQIERQYGQQTDDGLQTYELMLVIQQQIIENEIWEMANLQKRRNQLLKPSFH